MATLEKEFGRIMRRSRKASGITQETLAEIVNISCVYCRQIEHGEHRATWITWLRICSVLQIDISEIQKLLTAE
ncbi:MAG: helix-turn-helix domain-containing protein [Oscillospiraceae bacterium]|nr:helix-turn-helix domain-containing protein [Oscillospiraceae bacterium]